MARKKLLSFGFIAALALFSTVIAVPKLALGQYLPDREVERKLTSLVVLGDSFAGDRTFQRRLRELLPATRIRFDAVGGSSLAEQFERVRKNPPGRGDALLILDGGLTDDDPVREVARITATLQDRCAVWRYVEPIQRAVPGNDRGSPRWEAQESRVAAVERRFPGHVVRIMESLRALPPQTDADRTDIRHGWVAGSYRRDRVHLNGTGFAELARLTADSLKYRAALPCKTD